MNHRSATSPINGWYPSGAAAFVPIRNSRVSPSLLVIDQYRAPAVLASCVRIRRGFAPKRLRPRLCISRYISPATLTRHPPPVLNGRRNPCGMTYLQGTNSEGSESNNVFELADSDSDDKWKRKPSNKEPARRVKVSSPLA